MVKGKVADAWAKEDRIWMSFQPSEGNIKGKINMPCPEQIVRLLTNGRPLTTLLAGIVAKKLIGKEYDIAIFGQMSTKQRKRDLKRRGLWMDKDNKFEVQFEEKKDDKQKKLKYSEMWELVEAIEDVNRLEEFDLNGKRITFFRKDGAEQINLIKAFEGLPFIDWIKSFKKLEVR